MVYRVLALLNLTLFSCGWAHESLPLTMLAGVEPCVQTSSVQLGLEALPDEVAADIDMDRIRREIYDYVRATFEREGIPYAELCPSSPSFVLFGIYARFLEPQSYLGFPPNSYTYLTTGQLGTFSPQPSLETALVPTLYSTSISEIVQAADATALTTQLTTLGRVQIEDLVRHWLEANRIPRLLYGLFAALGTALVGLRLLPLVIR